MEDRVQPRRYAKACDACHRKKIRCIYREPACELCRKTGQQCKFTRMEKAPPKRPRRGKYFAALEERMNNMESLLQESRETRTEPDVARQASSPSLYDQALKAISSRDAIMRSKDTNHPKELRLPSQYRAMHLAQGYFASFNHLFPIFDKDSFMQRLQDEYPPDKHNDLTWWSAIVIVLAYAHQLRAMSTPGQAETENKEACCYIREALDLAPSLTYGRPSIETAQVLLGIASALRGTKLSDPASMLVAAAIRMLQHLDVHKEEPVETTNLSVRKQRERTFWVAYILDKENTLQTRQPPVLHEQDIGRLPLLDRQDDGVGIVRSLDSSSEVNLFTISQRLASIQGHVWNRIHSAAANGSRSALTAAQIDLNPVLAAWKDEQPFEFKQDDLVGRWPKYAIVHIIVLYFRYFQTLVELNKVLPMENDDTNPLGGDCPTAKALASYPHSTSIVAADAARNALDLAALTPRGNFQNVWLFFHFSISAVLTLLVNGIVRPLDEHVIQDLQRVDVWLRVIDKLATDSERPDLLERRDFLAKMKQWTLRVVQEALSGEDSGVRNLPCLQQLTGLYPEASLQSQFDHNDSIWDAQWIPELSCTQSGVLPVGLYHPSDVWENWPHNSDVVINGLH